MRSTLASLFVAVALTGCSSSSGGNGAQPTGDASMGDVVQATFGDSACGQCVASACSAATSSCNGTPDCQSYLSCLDHCPVAPDGNVQASCASGCPQPTSSSGQQAASQLTQCRTTGAGAACASCGIDAGSDASKDAGADGDLLHQNCAAAPDAGNPCRECIIEQCCDVRAACLSDPGCLGLLNCVLGNCPTGMPDEAGASPQPPDAGMYSCDLWCNAKTNPSLEKWAEYEACINILCIGPTQCGGATTCSMCALQHCAAEEAALYGTADGYLLYDCVNQCATGDTTCQGQCYSAYPSTMAAYSALGTCVQLNCPGCN